MASKTKKQQFDFWKSILKTATYTAFGTAATMVMQSIQGGMDIKEAAIYGLFMGCAAGLKNVAKHGFNLDLDLATLKK